VGAVAPASTADPGGGTGGYGGAMPTSDGFRKYIEAGAVLTQITRARAEEIVRELVGSGEIDRGQAQEWIDDLVERSRRVSQDLVDLVRHEVRAQLASVGVDADDLARQVADILRRSAEAGRQAAGGAGTTVERTRSAAREAASRARGGTAKRTGATRTQQKAPATKAAAKKAAAKRPTATKATATKAGAAPKKAAAKNKAAPRKAAAAKKAGT
jgi:polyhydroxyalkanoate synthesis regulator phasin